MQPHAPFIPNALQVSGNQESVWMAFRVGEFTREEIWNAYLDNLRYVLNDVSLLLENLDAKKVIITSDHGNALGEYGLYGHPKGYPLGYLRKIPWIETAATDQRTYEPEFAADSDTDDVSQRLHDLGYLG